MKYLETASGLAITTENHKTIIVSKSRLDYNQIKEAVLNGADAEAVEILCDGKKAFKNIKGHGVDYVNRDGTIKFLIDGVEYEMFDSYLQLYFVKTYLSINNYDRSAFIKGFSKFLKVWYAERSNIDHTALNAILTNKKVTFAYNGFLVGVVSCYSKDKETFEFSDTVISSNSDYPNMFCFVSPACIKGAEVSKDDITILGSTGTITTLPVYWGFDKDLETLRKDIRYVMSQCTSYTVSETLEEEHAYLHVSYEFMESYMYFDEKPSFEDIFLEVLKIA